MNDSFSEKTKLQVLDFATDKRTLWEKNHHLYSVIFEITPKCNFNCVHCYLHDHHCAESLSYEEIIEIIDILHEKGVLFLTFTGGDIFTRDDFLDIYLYAKKSGFIIELYTNGALIDEKIIDAFRNYPPLLVDISLYGSCEETYKQVTGVSGAFTKVMQNIQNLLAAEVRVSLKAPILNLYYDELPKMKSIADNYGVPFRTGFEIFPSVDNDDSVQQYAVSLADALKCEFSESVERPRTFADSTDVELVDLSEARPLFRCKLGRASCVIDYKGRMCPCMSFRHVGKKLTKYNFDAIWGSFRHYQEIKASAEYQCLKCKAYDYCDICPAMMQFVHADLEYIDEHFCKSAKARYLFYEEDVSAEEVIATLEQNEI